MQRNAIVSEVFGDILRGWEDVGLYAMIGVCFVFPFFVGQWSFSEDVLLWRIFNSSNSAHHMVIIWSMGVFFVAALRMGGSKVVSLFSLLMVVAVHELQWWLTDWFFVKGTVVQGVFVTPGAYLAGLLSGYLFPLSLIVCIFWGALRFRVPWRFILWMGVFYAVWALIGFPVSVNFNGPTAQYLSLSTNALEWVSWVWGLAGFLFFERAAIRSESLLTKARINSTRR